MAQLTVRRLDDGIVRRLKIRTARHGRTAEAEHRGILKQAGRRRGRGSISRREDSPLARASGEAA